MSHADPFEIAPDAALLLDGGWRIARANAAARGLLAAAGGDPAGDFWRAFPDAADPSRDRLYRAAMAGGPAARFDQHVHANDTWYAVRCQRVDDAGADAGLLVTLTDVTSLRRTDADLADREQRYRLIFERSPLPIFVYDLDTGRVTMANDAAVDQYRYPRSELIGLDVFELLTVEEATAARAFVGSFGPTTGVQTLSVDHRRADGSTFPAVVTSHGFVVAGRAVRATMAVDVTDRDRVERELRESERKYRSLIETADSVVISLDAAHHITEWNAAAERVSGYARAEVIGRNYHDLFLPADVRPAVEAESARLANGRATRGFEGVMVTRDGRRRTLLWNAHPQPDRSGQVTGIVAVAQDITDRKRAEDALRASEHLHRTLGDAMPQLMWTVSPAGAFEYVNARFTDFTGLTLADLARHGTRAGALTDGAWDAFVHPDDVPPLIDRWRHDRAAATAGEMEVRFCSRPAAAGGGGGGGQCSEAGHWMLVRVAPLTDEDGLVVRWVGTATDVDELKRTHADLRRAKEAAEHANEAKDQFLAVLSHELRTPLTPVLLTASALQMDPLLDADVRESVAMIVEQIELEARLIDDLLDLTRIARGKFLLTPQRLDGHDLVRRAVEVCRGTIDGAGVKLTVELAADARGLMADPGRIQQVLCNLLNNAAKFTPSRGHVTLRTYTAANLTAADAATDFVVEVSDTGVGIEPDALPRIFNAFEQGERSITRRFGGLGLGLTIGRTIADMHGGSLSAASDGPGRGATLTLRLPTVAASPEAAAPAAAPAGPTRRLRVLLVDDHVPTLRMMARLVTSLGHDVRTADSAAAAMTAVAADVPELMISDIGMPGGSGWSLLADVRAACPTPPVAVAVSGYGTDDDVRRSREAGFARHLVKPIGLADLRAAIADLTRES